MFTEIETEDGTITIDAYCPSCGGDVVPLVGRDCDCSLREHVVCSVVIDRPDREEPIRKTLTDRAGLLERQTLAALLKSAVLSAGRSV